MRRGTSAYLKGALSGIAAASIWASWSAITRFAVMSRLDPWDIAAMRFGVAGLLLLPIVVHRGFDLDRLGWRRLSVLLAGAGPPYVLLAAEGLRFAPAHDQGALNPGVMPLFVALIASAVLGERPSSKNVLGLLLVFSGVAVIIGWHVLACDGSRTFGHALFLVAAFLWASFTVVMRQANIDPLHATAIVSTGSSVIYLPFYFAFRGAGLAHMPIAEVAIQTLFQGVVVTIVSLILYGRAIKFLGASGGAAFGALVPALSALFAIPLLGEWPSGTNWLGIVLVTVGVYLASGGPLAKRRWP